MGDTNILFEETGRGDPGVKGMGTGSRGVWNPGEEGPSWKIWTRGKLEKLGELETWEPGYRRGGPKLVGVCVCEGGGGR